MDTLVTTPILQKYPIIGAATGIASGITYWIKFLSPVFSFIAIVLGAAVAGITFYLKVKELKQSSNKSK